MTRRTATVDHCPNDGMPWGTSDLLRLRNLLAGGLTIGEAAEELGRTRGGAEYGTSLMARKLPEGRRPNAVRRATVLRLLARGLSLRQIAREMGAHRENVVALVRRMERDGLVRRVGPPLGPGHDTRAVRYVPAA